MHFGSAEAAMAAVGGTVTHERTVKFHELLHTTGGAALSLQTSVILLFEPDGQPGDGGEYRAVTSVTHELGTESVLVRSPSAHVQ